MPDDRYAWSRGRALMLQGVLDPKQRKMAADALQAKEDRMRSKAVREAAAWIARIKARKGAP